MELIETPLQDCFLLKPIVFDDPRGFFFESFNQKRFNDLVGQEVNFIQDNQSYSSYGVIRGLHFQKGEHAQAKLVRVLKGAVLDVALDLRPHSSTFGKHFSIELSEENRLQLFIPQGFAHGFAVLSENAEFFYKCDNYYNRQSEGGILYNDKTLSIDWQLPEADILVSDKDRENPGFELYKSGL
ncbi:dTDP-4-dehydrorhamnose 3,5-epimerase [Flavihumibacter sp. R14]|nr:dTDP-4-dehydrorhamnose 3,5-epimerase [Flavihumibacter soli]